MVRDDVDLTNDDDSQFSFLPSFLSFPFLFFSFPFFSPFLPFFSLFSFSPFFSLADSFLFLSFSSSFLSLLPHSFFQQTEPPPLLSSLFLRSARFGRAFASPLSGRCSAGPPRRLSSLFLWPVRSGRPTASLPSGHRCSTGLRLRWLAPAGRRCCRRRTTPGPCRLLAPRLGNHCASSRQCAPHLVPPAPPPANAHEPHT